MNQPLEIAEVNRKALVERWPPGRASRLIAQIREKYDTLYLNQQTDGNEKGTQEAPIDKGVEGR